MTLPLLEGLDGVQKMSKSLGNYIGVTDSPKDIFGKVMSVSDDLMWRYHALILCTPEAEVAELKKRHPREAKDELARRIVARFHSSEAAQAASEEFSRVFSQSELPEDIPEFALAGQTLGILSLLVQCKLATSNSEARRLVEQGAVKVDDQRVSDAKSRIAVKPGTVLRAGKRGFARIG
jgi:tyrosyl-tRNA synthetase